MNLKEDIQPITYLKTRSASLVEKVNRDHRPVLITQNGQAKAVLQDIDSYEKTHKALLLLKLLAPAEMQVARGETVPMKEAFRRLKKRLKRG